MVLSKHVVSVGVECGHGHASPQRRKERKVSQRIPH